MISFLQGSEDDLLVVELREAGLLTPEIIKKIDSTLTKPSPINLSEFLLAGADYINTGHWLSWLIRKKGCYRFGTVKWNDQAKLWSYQGLPSDANFPYLLSGEERGLVAVLRPDRLHVTAQRLRALRPLWAAATLSEIKALRNSWVESYARRPYDMTRVDPLVKTTDSQDPNYFNFEPFSDQQTSKLK
jgi:hypothetical protein